MTAAARLALRLPVEDVLRRAIGFGVRTVRSVISHWWDRSRPSYAQDAPGLPPHRFGSLDLASAATRLDWLPGVTENYLAHRFDLLGSGWVEVKYGLAARGIEGERYSADELALDHEGRRLSGRINPGNLAESQRLWRLLDADYQPIDWHSDFKSGYRWREDSWYLKVRYGHRPGVDIKVPWELARMQHLPQLGLAFHVLRSVSGESVNSPERCSWEFRNQVLDFIATNPPRFGVNWRCAMDVAIRLVNWLLAWELFQSGGAEFDPAFLAAFGRSILDHGRHIEANLENHGGFTGNHYLADICGLAFAAAWSPTNDETNRWLELSGRELRKELLHQFQADGSNFEASTSYHRLATEIALYTLALFVGLPPDRRQALVARNAWPATPDVIGRIADAIRFARDITKPSGETPQIGDNDNGRFVKIGARYAPLTVAGARRKYHSLAGYDALPDEATYWDENHLDHRGLLAAAKGLFDDHDFAGVKASVETAVIAALAAGHRFAPSKSNPKLIRIVPRPRAPFRLAEIEIVAPGADFTDGITTRAFPDFGLYVFRSPHLYLAVRCGSIGQDGRGGHAHNDQLAVELAIDGEDWITDAGTYLYTPAPVMRNAYRSIRAHFAPRFGSNEPARLDLGLFWLPDDVRAECHRFELTAFTGSHRGFSVLVERDITILRDRIRIEDSAAAESAEPTLRMLCVGRDETRQRLQPGVARSPGYGLLLNP